MPGLFSFRRGKRDTAGEVGASTGTQAEPPAEPGTGTSGAQSGGTAAMGPASAGAGTRGPAAGGSVGSDGSATRSTAGGATSRDGAGPDIEDEASDPANAATEGMWVVIRPAAIVPEHAARRILVELARRDLGNGGEWQCEPQLWSRFDAVAADKPDGEPPMLMGTIHVTYGTPTKYEITLYRVSITAEGVAAGWSVPTLTDEALGFGGLTLAQCPRAMVQPPPRPFRY